MGTMLVLTQINWSVFLPPVLSAAGQVSDQTGWSEAGSLLTLTVASELSPYIQFQYARRVPDRWLPEHCEQVV